MKPFSWDLQGKTHPDPPKLRPFPDSLTIEDFLSQPIQIGGYSTWTEDQLISEVSNRRLVHGVSIVSFPGEQQRKARFIEMPEGNDKLRADLKKIAKECVK